jgi:hypothetical protein
MPELGDDPYEENLDWLKYGRVMIQESPKILDEAAKSFLTLGSSLLTVYTGALALFKLNEKTYGPLSWAVICTPILLWLLCISCLLTSISLTASGFARTVPAISRRPP